MTGSGGRDLDMERFEALKGNRNLFSKDISILDRVLVMDRVSVLEFNQKS